MKNLLLLFLILFNITLIFSQAEEVELNILVLRNGSVLEGNWEWLDIISVADSGIILMTKQRPPYGRILVSETKLSELSKDTAIQTVLLYCSVPWYNYRPSYEYYIRLEKEWLIASQGWGDLIVSIYDLDCAANTRIIGQVLDDLRRKKDPDPLTTLSKMKYVYSINGDGFSRDLVYPYDFCTSPE